MRRKGLIVVLALGAVAGFASGLVRCHYHGTAQRREFEDHLADVCLRAAERTHARAPTENAP